MLLGIDRLARSFRVGVVLATLATSAAFVARGAADLVALQLLSQARSAQRVKPALAPPSPASTDPTPEGAAILARNIFDFRIRGLPKSPVEPQPAPEPALPPPDPSAACDLDLRLSSVVFDPEHPDRSVVSLRGPLRGSSSLYRPGMQVEEHTLIEVFPRAAHFRHQGRSCWLRMFSANARDKIDVERKNVRLLAEARRRKVTRPVSTTEYAPPRALTPGELKRGIRERDARSFFVDRGILRRAMLNWERIASTTQVAPNRARGRGKRQVDGLRLVGVRAAGLLESLGLRSGDVLQTANGKTIPDVGALRLAIAGLTATERMTLTLDRAGEHIAYDYYPR